MSTTLRACTFSRSSQLLRPGAPQPAQAGPAALVAMLLLCVLSTLSAAPALAQTAGQAPLAQASVEALVSALAGSGSTTRSFRRTQLPQADSNLCADAPPRSSTAAAPATAGRRNLEVVPYAGDTTPGVNLSVQFATGSDKLASNDRALLDNLATALKSPELNNERFAIAGHTDSTGDARINLELSCARALAVRRYLMAQGVADGRLSAYGFGSERPLAGTEAANGQNRRVEVRKAPQ